MKVLDAFLGIILDTMPVTTQAQPPRDRRGLKPYLAFIFSLANLTFHVLDQLGTFFRPIIIPHDLDV